MALPAYLEKSHPILHEVGGPEHPADAAICCTICTKLSLATRGLLNFLTFTVRPPLREVQHGHCVALSMSSDLTRDPLSRTWRAARRRCRRGPRVGASRIGQTLQAYRCACCAQAQIHTCAHSSGSVLRMDIGPIWVRGMGTTYCTCTAIGATPMGEPGHSAGGTNYPVYLHDGGVL